MNHIDAYAFVSAGHAPALVPRDGSIDWWSTEGRPATRVRWPPGSARHWSLTGDQPFEVERRYAQGSLIVQSAITTSTGEALVTDALARAPGARGTSLVDVLSTFCCARDGIRGRVTVVA